MEELHKKAKNTFLWVALVFQQIQVKDCDIDEVLDFVCQMPISLHDMYDRMIKQILQQ